MKNINNDFINCIQSSELLIFKICHIYTKQKADFNDLYQEIIYQAWRSFNNFRGDCKPTTWIYKVALNTAITFNKLQTKSKVMFDRNSKIPDLPDFSNNYDNNDISILYKAINELNDIDKAIVFMYLENSSHAEIANITGITQTNVSTRLMRIKEKLRNYINTNQ